MGEDLGYLRGGAPTPLKPLRATHSTVKGTVNAYEGGRRVPGTPRGRVCEAWGPAQALGGPWDLGPGGTPRGVPSVAALPTVNSALLEAPRGGPPGDPPRDPKKGHFGANLGGVWGGPDSLGALSRQVQFNSGL